MRNALDEYRARPKVSTEEVAEIPPGSELVSGGFCDNFTTGRHGTMQQWAGPDGLTYEALHWSDGEVKVYRLTPIPAGEVAP